MKRYLVNDLYYTIQGEGVRAGTAAVFLRFAKCNLACNVAEHGFDCDTDFEHGDQWALTDLVEVVARMMKEYRWVVLTGGEPALQADQALVDALHGRGWKVAIETNGTKRLPDGIDWICCSPKPGTKLALRWAHEIKCVLRAGQRPEFPNPLRYADHYLVSPAFKGDEPDPDAIAWCVQWVKEHPQWRLSCQQHKWWGIP